MKKLIFAVISFMIIGCANPAIEDGLESLQQQLALVEADMAQVDVDQIKQVLADLEEHVQDQSNAYVKMLELKEKLAEVQLALDELNEAGTVEGLQTLGTKVAEISEGVSWLVHFADYDLDGVINGIDDCPDTPITEISSVDEKGCSPSQLGG